MFDHLQRSIENFERQSIERHNALVQSITDIIHRQNLTGQITAIDQYKQIVAHQYQLSSTYTNLIMLGGYAGIFGLWQLTKSNLESWAVLLTALLTAISLLFFAGFEVFKMVGNALFLRRLNSIIAKEVAEHERVAAWTMAWNEYSRKGSKWWLIFLIPTVITGFGAGFILIYALVISLFK